MSNHSVMEESDETYDYIAPTSTGRQHRGTQTDFPASKELKMSFMDFVATSKLVHVTWTIVGLFVMATVGYTWSFYLATLHENHFWFSNIREVEREISFRTEQGLYYSFYKHLVNSPNLLSGMMSLSKDTMTEHGHEINVWQRFNVVQELVLASLHKTFFDDKMSAIFFYVNSVFGLQSILICSVFIMAWMLSNTWMAGMTATALFFCHRNELTRVEFTAPLREHFAIPFIFAQCLAVGQVLNTNNHPNKSHCFSVLTFLCTTWSVVTWQFSQFILLLQVALLLTLALFRLLDLQKVLNILHVLGVSLLTSWLVLCCQWMVINSLVCSLIPVSIFVLRLTKNLTEENKKGLILNVASILLVLLLSILAALVINALLKWMLDQDADSHIFKFVLSKLTPMDRIMDFETRLYACLSIFQPLQKNFYVMWTSSGALPAYGAVVVFFGSVVLVHVVHRLGAKDETSSSEGTQLDNFMAQQMLSVEPQLIFHLGMASSMQLLALSASRLKCLWSPYICVLSPLFISRVLPALLPRLPNVRLIIGLSFVLVLTLWYCVFNPQIREELSDLREFYDPDTVDLMQWFKTSTLPHEAVCGSMQLMAAIKLCTNRPITNHPHFEDKALRERTRKLYDVYGRKSIDQVYNTLKLYDVSYVVLEDSICLHRSSDRCHLPAIVDLGNNHVPDDGRREPEHLVHSEHQRFCDAVRDQKAAQRLFKLVFVNKTFRVYKVYKS